jgi:Sulfate permease family
VTVPDSGGRSLRARLRAVPVLGGLLPVRRSEVAAEMLAGITLAAVSIPVSLGYAKIAGMPVVTGLYTLLLPMAVFAIFGSSRHLVVGADSATAAILAAALAGFAAAGSPDRHSLGAELSQYPRPFPPGLLQPPRGPADPRQHPPLPPGRLDLLADRHPPIVPAAFRKLDAAAVLTGPSLPAPRVLEEHRNLRAQTYAGCR